MTTLIVTAQGATLRCREGQIVVERDREALQRLPMNSVDRALLFGGINVTQGFVRFALDARLPVAFLSEDGRYRGHLEPGGRRDVALRRAQFLGLDDLPWRLEIAAALVRAKLGAQRMLLLRQDRSRPNPLLRIAAGECETLIRRIPKVTSLPGLMGLEGAAARIYFSALAQALRKPIGFNGRNRRPPRDPMNSLLSLGYALLTTECMGALSGAGLDPQVGIFHSSRSRVPALANDLVELFRAQAADRLALALFNLGVLSVTDFVRNDEGATLLTKPGLVTYLRHYRRRMESPFRDRLGRVTCFRKELREQALHLRRVVLREEPFVPFIVPQGGAYPAVAE